MRAVLPLAIALLLTLLALPTHAATRVPIRFNIPDGVETYTGPQPVTFGVPFPKDTLAVTDNLRVVDDQGADQPAQFEVTAHWTAERKHVRWLLVDCVANITAGKAKPLFLEFGPDVPKANLIATDVVLNDETLNTRTGAFHLAVNDNVTLTDKPTGKPIIERTGPVRLVLRRQGHYVTADGSVIAEYDTRYRFYPGCNFARIYHTLIWLTDDNTTIADVRFDAVSTGTASAGLDGNTLTGKINLRQSAAAEVTGSATGKHLDGWIATPSIFAALRWPWQQYPTAITASDSGGVSIHMINPATPMSLKPVDVAVTPVLANVDAWNLRIFRNGSPGNDVVWNGPEARPHVTPRGIARTWEILLWRDDNTIAPAVKNTFAQQPVLGYADPAFAVQAALPNPASPYDAQAFPDEEAALARAFDWYTRPEEIYGDYGTWNWGDIQWIWTQHGYPVYRYWNNNGKGWSIAPWALWLRSGDRRYFEHGEANSRHVMDVDTCHVPETARSADYKLRGGQYHYSAIHWGYGPQIFSFFIDSEYLPYCWYITGYERARDVMLEHANAMATWEERAGWMKHFHDDTRKNIGRHLYVMVKNLGALYEATWDPRLKDLMDECLALMEKGQFESGNFPHVKTNHYMDQSLCIAERIYGWERIGPMIQRWQAVQGDPLRVSPTGNVSGPMSLWPAVLLHERTGDAHQLDVAARVIRTQALTVLDSDNKWSGLNDIPGHEAGPALRDFAIAMSALHRLPPDQRPKGYLPMAGFHARVPIDPAQKRAEWSNYKHVAATLETVDKPITLRFSLLDGVKLFRLVITAPDGSVIHDQEGDDTSEPVSIENKLHTLTLPADGKTGVYTIEIYVQGREEYSPGVYLDSSTGKLVHRLVDKFLTIKPAQKAGQIFVKPAAGQTVEVSHQLMNYIVGRCVLLDPAGKIVASNAVTGSGTVPPLPKNTPRYQVDRPTGPNLKYHSDAYEPGLYSIIVNSYGDWHEWIRITGVEPWIAATPETWFNPDSPK